MFQELKDAFTVTLAKRLSSPFLSSFFLVWCVTNYDITLLVFSDNDWDTKVTYINGAFDGGLDYFFGFVIPICVSYLYISIWPKLDIWLYTISKESSIKYKTRQLELEKKMPISPEERDELEAKFNDKAKLFREEISERDARISE